MACVINFHLYEGRFVRNFEYSGTVDEGQAFFRATLEAAIDLNLVAIPIELDDRTMMIYPEHLSYWEVLSVSDDI